MNLVNKIPNDLPGYAKTTSLKIGYNSVQMCPKVSSVSTVLFYYKNSEFTVWLTQLATHDF